LRELLQRNVVNSERGRDRAIHRVPELQANRLPFKGREAKRFQRIAACGCFIFVAVGRDRREQCASRTADFDVQEVIGRRCAFAGATVEPEIQSPGSCRWNRDRLVNLSRNAVVYSKVHIARPTVGIITVSSIERACARQYPWRYAPFERTVDDQFSRSRSRCRSGRWGRRGSRSWSRCRSRRRGSGWGRRRRRRWGWSRRAGCQLETADSGAPIIGSSRAIILTREPESRVISWVKRQRTVIAPTVATRALASSAGNECSFSQGHRVEGIGRQSPGITQLGVDRGTGGAVGEADISLRIHRDASQPAPGRIWLVSAFLVNRDRPGSDIS